MKLLIVTHTLAFAAGVAAFVAAAYFWLDGKRP